MAAPIAGQLVSSSRKPLDEKHEVNTFSELEGSRLVYDGLETWVKDEGKRYVRKAGVWSPVGGLSEDDVSDILELDVNPYLFPGLRKEIIANSRTKVYLANELDCFRLIGGGTTQVNLFLSAGTDTRTALVAFRVPLDQPAANIQTVSTIVEVDGQTSFTLNPGDFKIIGIDLRTINNMFSTIIFIPGNVSTGGGSTVNQESISISSVTTSADTITIIASKANTTKTIEYQHPTTFIWQDSNILTNIPDGTYTTLKARLKGSTPSIVATYYGSVTITGGSSSTTGFPYTFPFALS